MKVYQFALATMVLCGCKGTITERDLITSTSGIEYEIEDFMKFKDNSLTVGAIIAKHIAAMGGEAAISRIKTLHEEEVQIKNGDTTRNESWYVLGEKASTILVDADTVSAFYATKQAAFAVVQTPEDPRGYLHPVYTTDGFDPNLFGRNYYSYPGILINYAQKGLNVIRVDKPEEPLYRLVVSFHDDRRYELHIDPSTFQLIYSSMVYDNHPDVRYVTMYKLYTRTPEGYRYPVSQVTKSVLPGPDFIPDEKFTSTIALTEFNPEVPDSIFKVGHGWVDLYNRMSNAPAFPVNEYEKPVPPIGFNKD
jgi:hypothetical protein